MRTNDVQTLLVRLFPAPPGSVHCEPQLRGELEATVQTGEVPSRTIVTDRLHMPPTLFICGHHLSAVHTVVYWGHHVLVKLKIVY